MRLRLADDALPHDQWPPRGARYINVAQAGLEFPRLFRWLDERPDIFGVFFLHDLLPLDRPEFFREGYRDLFARRVGGIIDRTRALMTTSNVTRERIEAEYVARRRVAPPIFAMAPPSALGGPACPDDRDEMLAASPYMVVIGTVEPRKNHATILDLWPRLARETGLKLAFVGARGWKSEATHVRLADSELAPFVRRVHGLSRQAMQRLIVNARAVLAPSLAEGFGLPVAEALALGAPVIASDLPVVREASQGAATFVPALEGALWAQAIRPHASWVATPASSPAFRTTEHGAYANALLAFLDAQG